MRSNISQLPKSELQEIARKLEALPPHKTSLCFALIDSLFNLSKAMAELRNIKETRVKSYLRLDARLLSKLSAARLLPEKQMMAHMREIISECNSLCREIRQYLSAKAERQAA